MQDHEHGLPSDATFGASGAIDPKMLERVRALLAKAESTTFPEEAEALTVKAQELMARHAIDAALLAHATGHADARPVQRRISVPAPYVSAKAVLLSEVSDANRCAAVWSSAGQYAIVFGFEVDIDVVELLFVSLLVQATTEMLAEGSTVDAWGRSSTKSFRQAFLTSFARRIGERLRETTEATVAEASAGSAALVPVLSERREAVQAALDEAVPHRRSRVVGASNVGGWMAGRDAADRADLGRATPLTPSGRALR